ncbi:MAG: adenylate kinase family protein [Acidimicrobiales bacterium]
MLLGRQGAGKGTQAEQLAEHLGVPRISTGDMFRTRAANEAPGPGEEPMGPTLSRAIGAGELMPDALVVAMVAERLTFPDAQAGFVMEGFPRTRPQAKALDELLAPHSLDLAVELNVPVGMVLSRLASRRVCSACGANFTAAGSTVGINVCDRCGGPLVERVDDNRAAIERRLSLYESQTAPVVQWYRDTGRLAVIDGTGEVNSVAARLHSAVLSWCGSHADRRRAHVGSAAME